MSSPCDVWVVIPAYNEETVIRSVIDGFSAFPYNIVVVDDCSSDGTLARLLGARVHVVPHPVNLGQGAAIQTGITYALMHGARFIVTFDSDGQHVVEEIPKLLKPLAEEGYDVALGTRFGTAQTTAVGIPLSKVLLLKLATLFTRLVTGLRLTDTHNGFRAFTADAARKLKITQNRMSHASQILQQIREHRLRYVEVPTTVHYTQYSIGKGQRMSNAFNIVWESITERFGS
jgi:glycosyltransferase involved in cell wall biosynthesis